MSPIYLIVPIPNKVGLALRNHNEDTTNTQILRSNTNMSRQHTRILVCENRPGDLSVAFRASTTALNATSRAKLDLMFLTNVKIETEASLWVFTIFNSFLKA